MIIRLTVHPYLVVFSLIFLVQTGLATPSVPFTVELATVEPAVVLSGAVEPTRTATVKIRWYALLKKIAVALNQEVKEGDLIAEVSLEYLDFRKKYFEGRLGFVRSNLRDARVEEVEVKKGRQKLASLVEKGIVAATQLDRTEVKLVDVALKRMRAEKEVKDIERHLDETNTQIKGANYYAPIAGIVTEMMVNPRQVSGAVIAMPDAKLARIDQPGFYRATSVALDTQAVHLISGMTAWVHFEATGERIAGNISEIKQNVGLVKSGIVAFDVVVDFEKKGAILPRGYAVRIDVPLAEGKKMVSVPWNAIRFSKDGSEVLKYEKAIGWSQVKVELGIRGRHRVEIAKGLKVGDIVEAQLW